MIFLLQMTINRDMGYLASGLIVLNFQGNLQH